VHSSSGQPIGQTGTRIKHLMRLRLEKGYSIAGVVDSIDPRGDTGLLKLTYFKRPASP
jgi:hypothetical protein